MPETAVTDLRARAAARRDAIAAIAVEAAQDEQAALLERDRLTQQLADVDAFLADIAQEGSTDDAPADEPADSTESGTDAPGEPALVEAETSAGQAAPLTETWDQRRDRLRAQLHPDQD